MDVILAFIIGAIIGGAGVYILIDQKVITKK